MEELTTCQFKATNDIVAWAYDDNKLFMTLAGAAGTGKSYLSRYILKHIPQFKICVSAPTHKALKVIKKESEQDGKTLQSLLGLAVDQDMEDFDPVNLKFDRKNRAKLENYDFVLVDEASMIQESLREYLQEEAKKNKVKILFVGDPIQLPPIGEIKSSVFENRFIDGGVVYLSTPCRQSAQNPAYSLLLADRHDIERSNNSWNVLINHLKEQEIFTTALEVDLAKNVDNTHKVLRNYLGDEVINEHGEGFKIYNSRHEFNETMCNTFIDYHLKSNYEGVKTLAWRNNTVNAHNKHIRKHLFPETPDALTPGDLLMCYRPITRWDNSTKSTYTLVHNSDELLVKEVTKELSGIGIKIYSTLTEVSEDNNQLIDFVRKESYNEYINNYEHYKKAAKKRGWVSFYGFYDNHLLLENLSKIYNNRVYPNKAFDYAYALTVHKSQGSTYNEVFIDMADIFQHYFVNKYFLEQEGKWNDETDRVYRKITRQLRYVAASRAKLFTHIIL
tara:strand:+ start:4988 stop:6496 length:1509 start_codon:yes stop_codon:yes gene_type:complete